MSAGGNRHRCTGASVDDTDDAVNKDKRGKVPLPSHFINNFYPIVFNAYYSVPQRNTRAAAVSSEVSISVSLNNTLGELLTNYQQPPPIDESAPICRFLRFPLTRRTVLCRGPLLAGVGPHGRP